MMNILKFNSTLIVILIAFGAYLQAYYASTVANVLMIVGYGSAALLVTAGVIGFGAFVLWGSEQYKILRARRVLAEREAFTMVITAKRDEQVMVKEFRPSKRSSEWQVFSNSGASQELATLPQLAQLPSPEIARLPDKILLPDVLPLSGPDLNNIVLGVGINREGQQQAITFPLNKMVHGAVGGSSGWGKSVFLQSLAYQMVLAPQAVELAMVDLDGITFPLFAHCAKLRYALADTEDEANRILVDLLGEMERRKQLFKRHPGVVDLESYNQVADSPLPIIALMIDEATALLGDKDFEANIAKLVLRARKYGIFAILGGQDWKSTSLDSKIKNQFSSKFQLKAQSKAQSRVLIETSIAADIDTPGRAWAILPGRQLKEIQTPFIGSAFLMAALASAGTATPKPAPKPEPIEVIFEPTPKQAQSLDLFDNGYEVNEIAKEVYGGDGGKQRGLVENALIKFGRI